jgi:NodT family efflux transporter outer membrane factor (OMF) lipoprotein
MPEEKSPRYGSAPEPALNPLSAGRRIFRLNCRLALSETETEESAFSKSAFSKSAFSESASFSASSLQVFQEVEVITQQGQVAAQQSTTTQATPEATVHLGRFLARKLSQARHNRDLLKYVSRRCHADVPARMSTVVRGHDFAPSLFYRSAVRSPLEYSRSTAIVRAGQYGHSVAEGLSLKAALAKLLGLALAVACVGPSYERPAMPSGERWAAPLERGLSGSPTDRELLAHWWTAFDDPLLTQLVARALEENVSRREAEARVSEARARRRIARAGFFPTVGSSTARSRAGGAAILGDQRTEASAIGDASWELDLFGGVRRGVEAANADLEARENDLRGVLVSLSAELALAYVDARSLQARLAIGDANLRAQSETLDITRSRAQAGLTTDLDVELTRATLEQTRAQVSALQTALAGEKNRIAVLLGEAPGMATARLDEPRPIPGAPREVAIGVPAEAIENRPDVRRTERELAAETARVGIATARAYPRLSLLGTIGLEALAPEGLFRAGASASSLASSAAWKLFAGGAIAGGIDAQKAVRDEALARFRTTVLTALEEVENALVAYAREQDRQASLTQAAESAQKAVALAQGQYRAGLVDLLVVREAERTLYAIQDQLASSEGEVTSDLIRLYKALGGGWTPQKPT